MDCCAESGAIEIQALADEPQLINQDPYGKGWICEVEPSKPSELDALMDAAAYAALLASSPA